MAEREQTIKNIKPIKLNLTDEKELENLKKYVDYLIVFDMFNEANNFVLVTQKLIDKDSFQKDYPLLYNKYQNLIVKASAVALPALQNKYIIELFETNLLDLLKIELVDLNNKLEAKFVGILLHDERDVFKRELRTAMSRNNQKIGKQNITVDNSLVKPSISNWIKDYNLKYGPEPVDMADMTQYFYQDKNANALSESDKTLLKKLIVLYERLKLSSVTKEGLDETVTFVENGQKVILNKGRLERIENGQELEEALFGKKKEQQSSKIEIKPEDKTPTVAQQIQKAYKGDDQLEQDIAKEEQALNQKVRNDVKVLREEFFRAVQLRNRARTIAALILLVRLNDLQNFLIEDDKLQKFMSVTWNQKYGQEFAKEFETDPTQPKFIKAFIRFILEDKLEMSESESARVAVKLANWFKKQGQEKYSKIAYFDLKDNKFKYFSDEEH